MQLLDRGHAPLVGIAPTLAAPNPPYNTDRPDTPHPATILVSARPEPQKPHQTTNGRQSNVTIRDCYQTPVDPGSERLLFMNIKRTGVAIVAAMTLVLAAGCHPTTSDITWTLSQQGVRDTYCFDKQLTNGNTKVTCSGKYGGKTRKWTGYLYPQDSSYTYMFPTSGEFPNFCIRYFNGKVCSTKNLSRTGSGQGHQRVSHPLIATEHRRRTPPRSTTRVPTRG